MLNQNTWWRYLLLAASLFFGALYALPNLFGEDPAVQISGLRGAPVDEALAQRVSGVLDRANIAVKQLETGTEHLLVRFNDTESQLQAVDRVRDALGVRYGVALNLAPSTPAWLRALDAKPMYLGLDLRGGVHFLMDVDMDTAIEQAEERYVEDVRTQMQEKNIRYRGIGRVPSGGLEVVYSNEEDRSRGYDQIRSSSPELVITEQEKDGYPSLVGIISEAEQRNIRKFALAQNITTLRNRINELGVAEPVVQQQGERRIVVQLPGVQDTVRAKEILGGTASLEYRLVDQTNDVTSALNGRVPPGSKLYRDRDGNPYLLRKSVIVTGDQVIDAASGFDSQNNSPNVSVTLDSTGARRMGRVTAENVGKPMAVVFIENKTITRMVDGEPVRTKQRTEQIISVATIRDAFSKRFQTTGLDSPQEARDLALLLRAGALAAPIEIVEERTIGPSLGKDNIEKGFISVVIGFVLVLIFMAVYYRAFGLVANMALFTNVVLIVSVLSLLQATLTLPGIAGIVLTVGMAVDANVLIFERIREELRAGASPQTAIHRGYEQAFSTIADANITTLIAAIVLFAFGTGPIKGFAVTLSIGIVTSMFTAIFGTRVIINAMHGGRRVEKLSI